MDFWSSWNLFTPDKILNWSSFKLNSNDSKAPVSSESNLTPEQLAGLKSLKKRVRDGTLIISDTDKSKKFALLTPEQYLAAGEVHTSKDLEISPSEIKKIKNVVNDHTWWFKTIMNVRSNWSHEDRISKNVIDKGEQACQMVLLIKDHKKWSADLGKPPPSRPVVSGNTGLNCHLLELLLSQIRAVSSFWGALCQEKFGGPWNRLSILAALKRIILGTMKTKVLW